MTAHSKSLYITKTGMTIDPGHAFFNIVGVDKVFNTINVQAYQPLQNAVKLGVVERHTKLMVFEIAGQTLSIPLQDMAYHHVAQGEQNGQAWVAFFCAACNMGSVANPVIDGEILHFSGTGIYNGMAVMRDAETGSFWEHATGECIQGSLRGTHLEITHIQLLLVEQVLENTPSALFAVAKQSWLTRLLSYLLLKPMATPEGHMPAPFRLSMGEQDKRLPELQLGLGIWINGKARFYSMETLKNQDNALIDTLDQESLVIFVDPVAQVPMAHHCNADSYHWDGDTLVLNTGERIRNGYVQMTSSEKRQIDAPDQQFVRWYAFAYKFPGCEIFGYQESKSPLGSE